MFYRDILPINEHTVLQVKLSNFLNGVDTKTEQNILPLNIARQTYNYDFSSGALTNGLGFKDLTITVGDVKKTMSVPSTVSEIKNFWFFNNYNKTYEEFQPVLVFYTSENKLYWAPMYTTDTNFYELLNLTFNSEPVAINMYIDGRNRIVFCSNNENDQLTAWDGQNFPVSYPDTPKINTLATHANRLFATVGNMKNELWFSDETNPCNWNVSEFDGGYIEINDERGGLNNVISYKNYLYIIREFGISRVSGYGEQTDFTIKHLALSNSRIYEKSAILCGDIILMLCRDGLYSFDGINFSKIDAGFVDMITKFDNSNAIGGFLDGKYYLACKLDFGDGQQIGCEATQGYQNNALIEFDINSGEYLIMRGVDICALRPIQIDKTSKLVACFKTQYQNKLGELTHSGKIFDTVSKKVWTSPKTDMGYPDKTKVLRNLCLLSKGDITVIIKTEEEKEYKFSVMGSNKPIKIPLSLRAKLFSISFISEDDTCNISNPQLEINLV